MIEAPEKPLLTEEVVEEIASLNTTQTESLRKRVLGDLFVFSKGICGYPDVNPRTHGAYCRFIQGHDSLRRMGLMPRGHLKSTIATMADSARLALIDPDDMRILIAGETAKTAQKFLSEIKGYFTHNKVMKKLFADVIPQRLTGPGVTWSTETATLVRNTSWKEATWTAIGVGGAAVGSHFRRIKCDDLIGFESIRSPAKMAEAILWCDNIEALLIDAHTDIIDWTGTRWSAIDLYGHLMEIYGADIAVFVRQAIENGEIIFPEKHTWAEYERLQTKRPWVWFAQYCNNPQAFGQGDFNTTAVNAFRLAQDGRSVHFLDYLTKAPKSWSLEQLDIVLTADPNSGSVTAEDTAAIIVSGISPDDEIFVLAAWSDRKTPSEFVDKIFELAQRWKPRIVGIEKAGQQSTQYYFEQKQEKLDVFFKVVPLKPLNQDKEWRIRNHLQPVIDSGQLFLLPSQTTLRQQIGQFPQNARMDNALIDELDALAYGPTVYRKPILKIVGDTEKNVGLLLRKRGRSRWTGY